MTSFRALSTGIRSATKSPRMILLLLVINFLIAAVVALAFRAILRESLGNSMLAERLTQDFDYTVYNSFMVKHGDKLDALFSQVRWLVLFYMVAGTFFGGGILSTFNNQDSGFSLRSFFVGCAEYFFRFVRLFIIIGIIFAVVAFVWFAVVSSVYNSLTANAVSEVMPFYLLLVAVAVFLIPAIIIIMIADYAKVATVVNDRRSMLKTSWQATKFVFKNIFRTFALQVDVILIVLLMIVLYWLAERQIGMTSGFTIAAMFVIQQVWVGGKIWTRLVTFSGELELLKAAEAPEPVISELPEFPPAPALLAAAPAQVPEAKKSTVRRKRVTVKRKRAAAPPKRIRRSR